MNNKSHIDDISRLAALLWAAPMVAAALFGVCLSILFRDFVMDDAYITFRYAAHAVSHQGLVFNPPERVEGISNIGWLLVLLPFAYVWDIVVASKVLGLLFLLLAVGLGCLLARRLMGDDDWVFPAALPLLTMSLFDYDFFSLTGMETALLSALLCGIAYLGATDHYRVAIALLCAFAFLVHPECVLLYPLIVLLSLVLRREDWKRYALPTVVFVVALGFITLARYAYFGDVLPNTFRAKPGSLEPLSESLMSFLRGRHVNLCWPSQGVLVLPFLIYGVVRIWKTSPPAAIHLGAIAAVGIAFALYAPSDWTGLARYSAPYAPVTVLLFWRGLTASARAIPTRIFRPARVKPMLALCAAALTLSGLSDLYAHLKPDFTHAYPGYVLTSESLAAPSQWIAANLPKDAIIATRRIGAVGYYSDRRIFDYCFGLTEREVARLIARNGRPFSHPSDPALAEIWKRVSPDYILEDRPIMEEIARAAGGSPDSFVVHGLPYRLARVFPLTEQAEWLLCKKTK